MQHNIDKQNVTLRETKYASPEHEFVMSEFGRRGFARTTPSSEKRWGKHQFNHEGFGTQYFSISKQLMRKSREKKIIDLNTQAFMDEHEKNYHLNRTVNPEDRNNPKRQKKIQKEKMTAIDKALKSSKKVRSEIAQDLLQENKNHIWPLNIIKSTIFQNKDIPLRDPNNVIIHIENQYFKLIYVSAIDHLTFKAEPNVFNRDHQSRMTSDKLIAHQTKMAVQLAKNEKIRKEPVFIDQITNPQKARWYLDLIQENAKKASVIDPKAAHTRLKRYLNNLHHKRENTAPESGAFWEKSDNAVYILNYDNDFDFSYRVSPDFENLLMMCFSLTCRIKQDRTKRVLNSLIYYNCKKSDNDYNVKKERLRRTNPKKPKKRRFTLALPTRDAIPDNDLIHQYPRRYFKQLKGIRTQSQLFDLALKNLDEVISGKASLGELAGPIDYWIILNLLLQHSKSVGGIVQKLFIRRPEIPSYKVYLLFFIKTALHRNAHYVEKKYLRRSFPRRHLEIDPQLFSEGGKLYSGELRKTRPLMVWHIWYRERGLYKISNRLFDIHGKLTD